LILYSSYYRRGFDYRIWNGTYLSGEYFSVNVVEAPCVIRAAADPTSDYIFACTLDARKDLNVMVWNGSSWYDQREIDLTVETYATPCVDVAWESSGNEVLVTWGHSREHPLQVFRWTKGTPLSEGVISTAGPDFGNDIQIVEMLPMENSDEIMVLGVNDAGELRYTVWDGDAFSPMTAGIMGQQIAVGAVGFGLAPFGGN
jgi:hypothetical protein